MARATTVLFVILIVFGVGGTLLQIFISKRESKWLGLVLPIITFLYSVVMMLNITVMETAGEVMAAVLSVVVTGNIPTMVLLVVCFACRGKRRVRSEVDKLRINDL
jgi:hypothetical protein